MPGPSPVLWDPTPPTDPGLLHLNSQALWLACTCQPFSFAFSPSVSDGLVTGITGTTCHGRRWKPFSKLNLPFVQRWFCNRAGDNFIRIFQPFSAGSYISSRRRQLAWKFAVLGNSTELLRNYLSYFVTWFSGRGISLPNRINFCLPSIYECTQMWLGGKKREIYQ